MLQACRGIGHLGIAESDFSSFAEAFSISRPNGYLNENRSIFGDILL